MNIYLADIKEKVDSLECAFFLFEKRCASNHGKN